MPVQIYFGHLLQTNVHKVKHVATPMSTTAKSMALDCVTFENSQLYRSVIRNLQYFALTQPDISFTVNKVCQFMHSSKIPH